MLAAIYVGLRFYRLKQRFDVSKAALMEELARLADGGGIPSAPSDLEILIAKELADIVEHSRPDSSEAGMLRLLAQLLDR